MERIDELLASTGKWSRREVKDLVRQGRGDLQLLFARPAKEGLEPVVDRRRFRQGGAAEEHIGETEELVVFVGE